MNTAMEWVWRVSYGLARACGGEPFSSTLVIILFWLMGNQLMAQVEKRITGESFEHWGDPIFSVVVICFASLTVFCLRLLQLRQSKG